MARVPIANLKGPKGERGERGLPGVNAVENDEAVAVYVGDDTSDTRAALNGALADEISDPASPVRAAGDEAWAARAEIIDMVTSEQASTIVLTSDPAELANADEGTLVFVYGAPGISSDFIAGVGEVVPVWGASAASFTHVDGTTLRSVVAGASNFRGAVLTGESRRDVDVLIRARYISTDAGLKCLVFARGTGDDGSENMIYAGIQAAATNAEAFNGLRLNAAAGGSFGQVSVTAETVRNGAERNQVNTWYYIRLRVSGDVAMAKQWVASTAEPETWDLMMQAANVPAQFKAGGASARGMAGFAMHSLQQQEFDWFAVAYDGATAPLKP